MNILFVVFTRACIIIAAFAGVLCNGYAQAPTSVVINEIHYDPLDPTKPEEFIEIHNPTDSAIDVSQWILDSGVDFIFPAGTSIPAGGYRIIAQNVAAFATAFPAAGVPLGPWVGSLKNNGERIRLSNAAGILVDEVDYKAGFPWPTSPKGGGQSCELIHPWLNNDLGGNWRAGTPPTTGGPLATYVPFGSTWRWRKGVVGDTGEPTVPFTTWRMASFTEPAPAATNAAWQDGVMPIGYGDNDNNTANDTENITKLTDMQNAYASIYMRKTFTVPVGQLPNFLQLRVKSDDGAMVYINGIFAGSIRPNAIIGNGHHNYNTLCANAPEPPPTDTLAVISAASVNLIEGNNIITVQGMQSSLSSSDFWLDVELTQSAGPPFAYSPGLPNTVKAGSASQAPPAVRGVEHLPRMPVANEDVIVSATISDPDGVGSVNLSYQLVDPGAYIRVADAAYTAAASWVTLTMNDAGTDGDTLAGDGVFSVKIPAAVQLHRRLVRYRITATDALSNSVSVPYADDEQPNFAYFCYNGVPSWTGAFRPTAFAGFAATPQVTFPSTLLASRAPLQLIALDADVAACLYTGPANGAVYRGTVVYDGKVYDHILFNVRGIGSTRVSGKNKLAFKFNRARDFQARDNWGRQFKAEWNSFGLDANASPWAAMHRGSAGVEEATSYRILELCGMVGLRTTYAHFRIIRQAAESNTAGTLVTDATAGGSVDGQYSGDLMGLYMMLEPTEGNLLDERDLPDGNIYAIEGNGGDKKHQATNQVSNGTDWTTYRTGRTQAAQTLAWYRQNMDLPSLYNYLALSRLIGNVDVRDGDNYRYYHRSSDDRWVIMGYDHDMQFICGSHWVSQTTVDGNISAGIPHSYAGIMRHPELALEYRNRCREILSLMASDSNSAGGQIGQLLDEYSQMVNPAGQALTWADVDAHMWNIHPRSLGTGAASGQTSHRGNFYRATFTDARGAGTGSIGSSYLRHLTDADGDGFSDHEGVVQWFKNYATNTYPAVTAGVVPWTRRPVSSPTAIGGGTDTYVHRQKGFGYKYLERESLQGGHFAFAINPAAGTANGDLTATGSTQYATNGAGIDALSAVDGVLYPDKPTISYAGVVGNPLNGVQLHSSDFSDPQNDAVAAVQWRVGEISAPGLPLYDPTTPRIYEIEELWRSAEIVTASGSTIADITVPASVLRVGHTYRARVRHKDATGRWSFWSEPYQFEAGAVDLSSYVAALRISEINYNPSDSTVAERAHPNWNVLWNEQEFEFLEIRNVSAASISLADLRFTKGIDFNFAPTSTLDAGSSTVVVKNPIAFAIRYPGVTPMGVFEATDSLSNGGEQLKLSFGAGSSIIDFTYGDSNVPGWPTAPDGVGATLVLRTPGKPSLDHGDASEWRNSTLPLGKPADLDGLIYSAWAAGNSLLANPSADVDHDGFDNRLEYALAADPVASSTESKSPQATFREDEGIHYATLTFTRRNDAQDLLYSVEFSSELMDWVMESALIESVENGDGTTTETWRTTEPVSTLNRWFGRVRVTALP